MSFNKQQGVPRDASEAWLIRAKGLASTIAQHSGHNTQHARMVEPH
jgi:hypothetical protein